MPTKIDLLLIISRRIDRIDSLLTQRDGVDPAILAAIRAEEEQAWQEIDALIDALATREGD